jgi:predicted DCC family thiol-disulfide oxidoreductase YuxK/alkylated DNA nucleotide flippase Atl1
MDKFADIYAFVKTIPAGKVLSYGEVGQEVGATARQVGSAMRFVPEGVPWQRVVGSDGRLPIVKRDPELYQRQRELLESEGVVFTRDSASGKSGKVSATCFWDLG